jgi:AcrR family transcriptional regulator
MTRTTSRRYGGVEADDRRATRRAALIEAALDLLGNEGWQATTVRRVCADARLTPRYFYESFEDLEALLLAVFDQVAEELAGAVLAAVAPPPGDARATARAAIAAAVELFTADPRKARVLFAEAMGSDALARRRFDALRGFAELVAAQGREFYRVREGSDSLIEITALMLVGGLAETFMAWLNGNLAATRDQLIDDLSDLFVAAGETAVALARRQRREP